MSEYTLCNYCKLQSMRRDVKKKDKRLVSVPSKSKLGGYEYYMINKNEKLTKKNWICWFWEVTDHCVC
jgi:predicted Zn-ribbon and HTH transcriptional regulator